jgi:hypothetical protein
MLFQFGNKRKLQELWAAKVLKQGEEVGIEPRRPVGEDEEQKSIVDLVEMTNL